ncbi:MAG: transcription termination/antitermination protein NusG [Chlamydiota bacterium]
MQKWFVVQVMSGLERRVKKTIDENREAKGMATFIGEVLVPTENVSEVKKGEQKISEKKLWPGYLFVKMELTDESWGFINETNGVIGFLGGGKPQPLPESEVQEILQELESRKKAVVQKHKVEVGDTVKIIDGVFINFLGKVIEVFHEKGRLSVLVLIFGRETRVDDLEFWQVEQSSPESGES